MKILDINNNPIIRAYTHELYVHSIASGKDKTGNKLAEIKITSSNSEPFIVNAPTSEIRIEQNVIEQYSDLYEKQTESYVYHSCDECDELSIKIDYQQDARPWAVIYLFVKNAADIDNQGNFHLRFGRFCNQALLIDDKVNKKFIDYKHNPVYPYWLKIKVSGDIICSYISFNGKDWMEIYKGKTNNQREQRVIGICFDLQNNNYYNWLFCNHIQLYANKEAPIALDYIISPYKDYKPYTCNPFINFIPERQEVIEAQFLNIMEFVRVNIDCNRYIEAYLDEFYLSMRDAYQKRHFNHTNLIYGYDDKYVYILGITQGKPLSSALKTEDFLKAYDACKSMTNVIFIFDYFADTYDFNLEFIIDTLNDYLSGIAGNMRFYNIPGHENNLYGINVYNEFVKGKGLDVITNDQRVSYVLLEHKLCMRERIRFLVKQGFINDEGYTAIINDVNELCEKADLLLRTIVKNNLKTSSKTHDKVKEYLMELKDIELRCYSSLLKMWRNYINGESHL